MAFDKPQSRNEAILQNMLGANNELEPPKSRVEALLQEILESGGGGGGTSDYSQLTNKPQINGTTLTGNKSASDLSLATTADLAGKVDKVEGYGLSENDYTDADKAIVGGVTAALAGKQDKLTAGNNIKMENNAISVNRWFVPAGKVVYTIITSDENYGQNVHVQRHTIGGEFIDDRTFTCEMYKTVDVDGLISIWNPYSSFKITLLEDSDEQQAGYNYTVNPITTPTSNSFTFLMEQEENANDLIIRSELDAEVNAIKDGQSIDSFADVETALATKADLTDLAPAFSTSTAYTVGQYVSYDGNIYKCTSAHSAGAWVAGDFTLVAVGSELESKQNATDNSLQTTDKTVVGAINEHEGDISSLMSGLTNLDVELSVPDNSGKNLIPMSLAGIKSANTNGTWADNVYTLDGLTFTVLTDSAGNVIGVKANGTAPANDVYFSLGDIDFVKDTSYRMTSGTTGSATDTYRLWAYSSTAFPVGHRLSTDANCGENVARNARANERCFIAFMIMSGYAPENVTVYPMVRLASVSDSTFAPYIPSVESRIEAVESGLTSLNNSVAKLHKGVTFDPALTSIDIGISDNNLIWLVGFECASSANTPCGGLYVLFKQGTNISLTALKEEGTPGLSVTIKSSNVLTFSWTALNNYGGNITMIPMIFW